MIGQRCRECGAAIVTAGPSGQACLRGHFTARDADGRLPLASQPGDNGAGTAAPDRPERGADARQREGRGPSQASALVELALAADVVLWCTPEHEPWVSVPVADHTEHHLLKSKPFRRWLARLFHGAQGKAPGAQALQDALAVLEGKALFEGAEHQVFTRLAQHGGRSYLDLCNPAWQALEIDPSGWRIVDQPPVRFRRARGMLPLPTPVAGGTLGEVREFLNASDENTWRLIASWLLAASRPTGPYPLLSLGGEQGSGKSVTARVLRALLDPNAAAIRSAPREVRDIMIAATNGWEVALDNLSHIDPWLSDCLCRLATGGGFATRELYSDADEAILNAQRPVVFTAIEDVASRGDLLDRCIVLNLPAIPEDKRRPEAELWAAFEAARPRLLGALLSAVSGALRELPGVKLEKLPRMADFAIWATAAERALGWPARSFLDAYAGNREAANETALEASPIVPPLRVLLKREARLEVTAGELLEKLDALVTEKMRELRAWPKSPRALAGALRRLASNLRAAGIEIAFERKPHTGERTITLEQREQVGKPPSPPSPPSPSGSDVCSAGDGGDAKHAEGDGRVTQNTLGDGGDAKIPTHSKGHGAPDLDDAERLTLVPDDDPELASLYASEQLEEEALEP